MKTENLCATVVLFVVSLACISSQAFSQIQDQQFLKFYQRFKSQFTNSTFNDDAVHLLMNMEFAIVKARNDLASYENFSNAYKAFFPNDPMVIEAQTLAGVIKTKLTESAIHGDFVVADTAGSQKSYQEFLNKYQSDYPLNNDVVVAARRLKELTKTEPATKLLSASFTGRKLDMISSVKEAIDSLNSFLDKQKNIKVLSLSMNVRKEEDGSAYILTDLVLLYGIQVGG